ncbi:MAG TPA: cupredoxin domain-containing protein [Solirubrobacteraceae bacterium]|jgi:plastocyanin
MAVLLATGLLAAAGCGDDDDEDEGSGGATPSTQADTGSSEASGGGGGGTKVSLTEFKIDPANPKVKAGKVTFSVSNDGQVPHALEVEGNGIEEETDVLNGGDSAELSVDLKAGEYEWYCPVGNHADMGMKGTLTVE